MSVKTRQFGGSHGSGHQEEEAKEQTGQTGWTILGQMLRSPGVVGSR